MLDKTQYEDRYICWIEAKQPHKVIVKDLTLWDRFHVCIVLSIFERFFFLFNEQSHYYQNKCHPTAEDPRIHM